MGGLSAGGHLAAMTALERGPELGLAGQMGIRGGLKRGRLLVVVWGILGYL